MLTDCAFHIGEQMTDLEYARQEILSRGERARKARITFEPQIIQFNSDRRSDADTSNPDWDDRANII